MNKKSFQKQVCNSDISRDIIKSFQKERGLFMNNGYYIEETSGGTEVIPVESLLLKERKLFIDEKIDQKTAVAFVQAMMYLSAEDKPIDIYISSPGGEVNAGLAMYDALQGCKNKINMYCVGMAASMAAVLLAAGQKGRRFILPHSQVLIHEVLVGSGVNGSATSIAKISRSIMETRDVVNGILSKHTGKSTEEINEATGFDNLMNAEQAVSFGICDKIVNSVF